MILHELTFTSEAPPSFSPDDPDVTVWLGSAGPLALAKRVGESCHVKLTGVASYEFPVVSEDRSVRCAALPEHGVEAGTVVDAYYRTVVPLALQVYGLESMHGAAVERGGRALLLCGASGTGKSTLASALAARGAEVLADDGLVIEVVEVAAGPERAVLLHPLPFALMLREPSAAHFGRRARARVQAPPLAPGGGLTETAAPVPLAAVVLLERATAGESALSRLAPAEAFPSLLAHAYTFSLAGQDRKRRMLAAYLAMAGLVPVHRLRYPSGLARLGEVAELVEGLA